jgi:hypothetical protein
MRNYRSTPLLRFLLLPRPQLILKLLNLPPESLLILFLRQHAEHKLFIIRARDLPKTHRHLNVGQPLLMHLCLRVA